MFDIFVKRKKIFLDCFTSIEYVYKYAKIDYADNFYPDWWKKMNNQTADKILTIKYCSAFTNLYSKGIIIPSWFSLKLNVDSLAEKRYSWQSSNDFFRDISHPNSQFKGFSSDNGFNFKIQSPWKFKTKRKIHFIWSDPIWNNRNNIHNYSVLPGVIEFRNQPSTNINLFITYNDKPKTIFIDPLQPLVMLHPMSEKKIEIKNHLISEKELNSLNNFNQMFFRDDVLTNYNNLLKFRKKRETILDKLEKDNG